jgi:myo-inositol 2-dehydrogenase / D-chiro-inositol 1-dehydrogenase
MTPLLGRRTFLLSSTALAATALLTRPAFGITPGKDRLRLGLIGCGGRGLGAVCDALLADLDVELVAVADLFPETLETYATELVKQFTSPWRGEVMQEAQALEVVAKRAQVPTHRRFSGWEAYRELCELADVDIVLLAAPPVFRPLHLEAALANGKHVFMEKPVCVDPVGGRKLLELAAVADAKKLCVVAGTQRRHQAEYLEGIQRIHDGQIGDIVSAQCYWLMEGYVGANLRHPEIAPDQLEYQIRNWFCFVWASGDHIVEQHVHNIDVINWALQGRAPESCTAIGGRGVTLPMPAYGNRYSHFAADFDYGNGLHVASYCRQEPQTSGKVTERIVGTKGVIEFKGKQTEITGERPWRFAGEANNPYVQEHVNLIRAVRSGTHINETRAVTSSTMLAVLARESAYTGHTLRHDWLWKASKLNLAPETWAWGVKPIAPLPVPGVYSIV